MGSGYYDGHRDCPGPNAPRAASWQGGARNGRTSPLYVRVYIGAREGGRYKYGQTTQKRAWTRVGTLCIDCGTISVEDRIDRGARVTLAGMATRAGGRPGISASVDQAGPSEPEP